MYFAGNAARFADWIWGVSKVKNRIKDHCKGLGLYNWKNGVGIC